MEREQDRWKRIYQVIGRCGIDGHSRHRHKDSLIVGVLLWAALNDRPVGWATETRHWPAAIRPPELPSQPTMSRRLRSQSVLAWLQRSSLALREQLPSGILKFIDAKPLPIGGCTKDPDAGYGRAAACKAKGYKLFVLMDAASGSPEAWRIGPMNLSEQHAAVRLLEHLRPGQLVLGDGEYEASALYELAAGQDGALLAEPPEPALALGHRRQSPERLVGLAAARSSTGAVLLNARIGIEQSFGNWTSFGGGLGPLPAWVRRPHRVVVWLGAKFLIDLDRRIRLAKQKASAA